MQAKIWIGLCYLKKKLFSEAIDYFTKMPDNVREKSALLSYAYALSGDETKASNELKKTWRNIVI